MTDRDEAIGRNVRMLRGERSQDEVAELMRARGYKWSQSTVWAVEKGDRPLRLTEAEDLTAALGSPFYSLLGSEVETAVQLQLKRAGDAYAEIKRATTAFLQACAQIEGLTQIAAEAGTPLSDPLASGGGWFDIGPVDAVREATYEWEHRDDVGDAARALADRLRDDTAADTADDA